jgi:hypothetical protein
MKNPVIRTKKLTTRDPRAIFIEKFPELTLCILRGEIKGASGIKGFICKKKAMEVKTATKLHELTDISAEFWLRTQLNYELHILELAKQDDAK